MTLGQVKVGNNSENLLSEIRLFILCINQMKSLETYTVTQLNQYKYKMNTIFMNSENSKTSKPHVLILNLTDKIDVQRGEKRFCFIKS